MSDTTMEYTPEVLAALRKGEDSPAPKDDADTKPAVDLQEPAEQTEQTEDDASEYGLGESKARAKGWAPKEEWRGDDEDWIDYREFNRRGELMTRIQSQTKEMKTMRAEHEQLLKTVSDLSEHNVKLAEAERAKVLRELRTDRSAAIRGGDDARVAEIEETIEEVQDIDVTPGADNSGEEQHEVEDTTQQFTSAQMAIRDGWEAYGWSDTIVNDPIVRQALMTVGDQLYAEHTDPHTGELDIPVDTFLRAMEDGVKEHFPHKFKKAKAPRSRVSDGGDTRPSRKKGSGKYAFKDLSDEQKAIAIRYEKQGAMTREKYVEDIAAMGELPVQRGE